jgi:hypothetical protein
MPDSRKGAVQNVPLSSLPCAGSLTTCLLIPSPPLLAAALCRQYHYVLQSLTLWREIMTDMFKLWYLAESDMLREGNSYRLCDTGQGLNRVQAAPQVSGGDAGWQEQVRSPGSLLPGAATQECATHRQQRLFCL